MKRFLILGLFCSLLPLHNALAAGNLFLTSPLVEKGKALPRSAVYNANGCNGENISPTLDWSGAPPGTRSYAISMFDPDANNGSGFLHWAVLNLPYNDSSIAPDSGRPDGTKLVNGATVIPNSWGEKGYGGPCPPVGETHHYEFTVYAMPDAQMFYPLSAVGKSTIQWLHEHALESATLTVIYGR